MGNTILIQLREIDPGIHRPYLALPGPWRWMKHLPKSCCNPMGQIFVVRNCGLYDTINDADKLRDELLALAHGFGLYQTT